MTRLNVTVFSLTKNNALYGLRLKNNNFIAPSTLPLPHTHNAKTVPHFFLQTSLSTKFLRQKNPLITLSTQPQNFFIIRTPKKTVFLLVKNFSGLFRLSLCCPINATRFLINNDVLI